jgi:farnesyl diphosphate synthase
MRYSSLLGGKRIRPLFTIAAGVLNNAPVNIATTIGATIELIHCFSLIHDDLPSMDNDDLRRGKPTNHKVYGDAVALLAGDALHTLCFEILSSEQLVLPAKRKLEIIRLIAKSIGVQGMVGGQTIDWLSTGKQLNLEQLQEMHLLKTGALLRTSILVGYLAGENFDADQYELIDIIAQKIGLLFQIVDDIIDVTEDTVTLGKTANKDQDNNKATYVNILGLEQAQIIAKNLHHEIVNLLLQQVSSKQLKYLTDLVYFRHS